MESYQYPPDEIRSRLLARSVVGENGCWIWQGSRTGNQNRYGAITFHSRNERVHRLAWVSKHRRPVPAHLQIDHLCRTPLCCNPDHLEAVTAEENLRRAREHRGPRPISHGTDGGFRTHKRRGDEPCLPCREAHRAKRRQDRARNPNHRPRVPKEIQHGTNAGYMLHHYRGETTCPACRKAHREYDKQRRASKAATL